jgi:hypothetical protein
MRKLLNLITIILLAFVMSACTINEMIASLITPTLPPPPEETPTSIAFKTPSKTPTATIAPTFTATPTLVDANSDLEDGMEIGDVAGDQPLPTLYVVPSVTPEPHTSLIGEPGSIILSMTLSSSILFWGYCDVPKYVDFDVVVAHNPRLRYVLLFMRLVDKGGNQSTAWGGGAIMEKVTGGNYTYRVRPENISHYEEFENAWIEYQVVAATGSLISLGRTPVYQQNLTLKKCQAVEVDE